MIKPPYKYNALRSYLILIGLIALSSTPIWIIRGLPFLILGIIIRIWAKGYLRQNKKLTTSGPYSLVRHPFYFGNLFVDFGIVVMSGFIPLMILFPFLWFSVYILQMKREEKLLLEIFGDAYKEYQKRVPMIIPYKIPKTLEGEVSFSWKNNIPSEEIHRTFRLIMYPFIFFLSYLVKIYGIKAFFLNKGLLICSIIVSLWIMSYETRKSLSQGKRLLPYPLSNITALLLILILLSSFFIRFGEVELDPVIWPIGLGLICISIIFKNTLFSEWTAAVGVCVLSELLWLSFLVSSIYLAMLLDDLPPLCRSKKTLFFFITIGICLALIKEININPKGF